MKKAIILLFILLFISPAFADYYADVDIVVNENGVVSISGLTNHPLLSSGDYNYTHENLGFWMLNITLEETFSNYVYSLTLPSGAVINYLRTPSIMSLGEEDGHIVITAIGNDEPFKAVIQYNIETQETINYYYFLFLLLLIPLFFIRKKKVNKIDYLLLTNRQKQIMKIVEKKKQITQKELETRLKFPKSSLSRNIESLIRKRLIKKEKKGVTNVLILK